MTQRIRYVCGKAEGNRAGMGLHGEEREDNDADGDGHELDRSATAVVGVVNFTPANVGTVSARHLNSK